MKTTVYVDGYNLFYSRLTQSQYKWLDLVRLFEEHLLQKILLPGKKQPAAFDLVKINYFTAPILGKHASDPKSPDRQAHYHRALKARSAHKLRIISGFHQLGITKGLPIGETVPQEMIKVQVMEEKQTDVNIALHMYRDAMRGDVDAVVLCSNDSDLEPVLAMIRQDCPHVTLGLVLPRNANNPNARKSGKLERHVHWVRHHIQDSELADSQLPERILDHRNRSIRKPDAW